MPSPELIDAFRRAKEAHTNAGQELVPLLASMALATARDVLPEAACLEVSGELNEDWLPILRIQRVLDDSGTVLFDVGVGHDDETVESAIDDVNIEYLDPLLELTADDFMGERIIDAETVGDLSR
jgi:hypothetical protein